MAFKGRILGKNIQVDSANAPGIFDLNDIASEKISGTWPTFEFAEATTATQLWRLRITSFNSGLTGANQYLFDIQNANSGEGLGDDTDNNGSINTDFLSSHSHTTNGSVIAGQNRYGFFGSGGNPITGTGYFNAAIGSLNSVSSATQNFMNANNTSRFYCYTPVNSFLAIGFATPRAINTVNFLEIRTKDGDNYRRTPLGMKLEFYKKAIDTTYDSGAWTTYATLTNTTGSTLGSPRWRSITDGSTIAAS